MINGSAHYATAAAFRRAVEHRLKAQAATRGRQLEQLRREFLFQRLLALIFAAPDNAWVLKGGASLLMRLPAARYSRDLDLLRLGQVHPDDALADLRDLTAPGDGDHLTFVLGEAATYSTTNPVLEISVAAYIGGPYQQFSIDLATDLHMIAAPDRITPKPVVELPGLSELPAICVYPITDQVADKICAMYELYGDRRTPSSRYRDLIDLALIVSSCELDAALVSAALHAESARRNIRLPTALVAPASNWSSGYRAYARKTRIDAALHDLESALRHVGMCMNPLLGQTRTTGRWQPGQGWRD